MPLFFTILLGAFAESAVSFVGRLFAIVGEEKIRRFTHFMISFAVGALLSVAFLELIPEAMEMAPDAGLFPWVLAGILFLRYSENQYAHHDIGKKSIAPIHTAPRAQSQAPKSV